MNSLQTKLALTALTNTVARIVKRDSGKTRTYLRLRLNARDFAWCSPEIGYLNENSQACFVARATFITEAESITSRAFSLAKEFTCHSEITSPASMTFELEAVEIGHRWCLWVKATAMDPDTGRTLERSFQYRVLSRNNPAILLAA